MQKYKVTEDAAYKIIRQISMEKRKPMKKIAEAIILKEEGNKNNSFFRIKNNSFFAKRWYTN